MRAEATRTDQWSGWEMSPEIGPWPGPGDTAGTNGSGNDGFDIDRRGVRAVSGKLIELAHDGIEKPLYAYAQLPVGFPWKFPHELARFLYKAGLSAVIFWRYLNEEIGTAGVLIERACTRYDLVDNPRLGDMPFMEAGSRGVRPPDRLGERPPLLWDGYGAGNHYPNGTFPLPSVVNDGVDRVSADRAATSFYRPSAEREEGIPTFLDLLISSLVELANTLPMRAQDLHDAPWRGEAADLAQRALRQTYENFHYLATWADTLDAACKRFLEVVDWYANNFHEMVDPYRPYGDELLAFGATADSRTKNFYAMADPHRPYGVELLTTADSRARAFLGTANSLFLEVLDMIPQPLTQNLPGLMVVDENLKSVRSEIKYDKEHGPVPWYQRGRLEENERLVQDLAAAERTYG